MDTPRDTRKSKFELSTIDSMVNSIRSVDEHLAANAASIAKRAVERVSSEKNQFSLLNLVLLRPDGISQILPCYDTRTPNNQIDVTSQELTRGLTEALSARWQILGVMAIPRGNTKVVSHPFPEYGETFAGFLENLSNRYQNVIDGKGEHTASAV